jgi:hypothetical protein
MSAVIAVPELMAEAATDMATIGSNLSAAHMTAKAVTVAVLPAAADEVSASIAHLFSGYGQDYQKLAGEAAASYEHFVQHLTASAGSYASAEAANTALLQPLTATADSIGSAIGAFWDQLVNMFNAAVGQLGNMLTGFLNELLGSIVLALFVSFLVGLFVLLPLSLTLSLIVLGLPFDLVYAIFALFGINLFTLI